MPTKGIR